MPNVVVVGGKLQCSHGGIVQLLSGSSLLEIAGAQVVTSGMEAKLSFAAGGPGVLTPCPLPAPPSGPLASSSCTATVAATSGVSQLLTVGGIGALMDTAQGQAVNPNDPSATWSVAQAGQTLVIVDS
jgi:hypothetical protein